MLKFIFLSITLIGSFLTYKLLFFSRTKSFLGIYIFSLTIITVNQYLSFYNSYFDVFPIFNPLLGYILAPLLYFHLLSLLPIKNATAKLKSHLWYNIPIILYIIFWIFDDYRRKLLTINTNSFVTLITLLQCVIYLGLYIKTIRKFRTSLSEIKLTRQFQRVQWSHYISALFLLMIVLVSAENLLIKPVYSSLLVQCIFGVILIQWLLIFIRYLTDDSLFIKNEKSSIAIPESDHLTYKAHDQEELEIINSIELLMTQKKRFKDPKISLNSLAEELDLPPYRLSKILNSNYHQSFHEFINSHRLLEAKHLLSTSENADLRINEIMYEIGFSSKSSFNTWFKKHTGTTPSAFRKLQKSN